MDVDKTIENIQKETVWHFEKWVQEAIQELGIEETASGQSFPPPIDTGGE